MCTAVLLLATAQLVSGAALPAQTTRASVSRPQQVVDVHVHALGSVAEALSGKAQLPSDSIRRAIIAMMDKHHVPVAVLSGSWPEVQAWCKASPGRFIGGPVLMLPVSTGRNADPDTAALHRAFGQGCLGVIGEIANQYAGMPVTDPRLEPYWSLAEQLDLPVGVHTGSADTETIRRCCPDFRLRFGNPLLLEDVLVRHPKLRVYLMHGGEPWRQETAALLDMYPQVYLDVGILAWLPGPRGPGDHSLFHEYLGWLIARGYDKRIMFGSDAGDTVDLISPSLEGVTSARFLTAQQRRDILYANAARFFRLEGGGRRNP